MEQLTTQHTKQMTDIKSDLRKQDVAIKSQGSKMDTECDRLRQMFDAIGDQVHLESNQQKDRIEQAVREVFAAQIQIQGQDNTLNDDV